MHYLRFLKTPKVQVDRGSVLLKAVLTLTTDLGETFYPNAVELIVTLRSTEQDGDIYLRKRIQWQAGARSVVVAFDISRQDIEWPAVMHVTTKNNKSCDLLSPFLDVWSGPLNPTKGNFDSGRRVERRFTTLNGRSLVLLEDAGDSIARHLWDGSQALAQHIGQTISLPEPDTLPLLEYLLISATYRRLNVLELGCGCGTVGIFLAHSIPDCRVLLTDLPEAADLVAANLARLTPAISARAAFEPLDWLAPTLPDRVQNRKNDLIVVSECTYNADTLGALVRTLSALIVRSPKAVIVVATKTRHDSEAGFFKLMLDAGFTEEGVMRLPLPGEPGTGYADGAKDVGLHVYRGKDHRLSLSPRNASEEEVPKAGPEHRAGSR